MLMYTRANITPEIPVSAVTHTELLVLDLAGITFTLTNQGQHLKFWSSGAVDLHRDPVASIYAPQRLIDRIELDYPTPDIPHSWVVQILIELCVHVAGYGNTPYEGRLLEDENFALCVLQTIAQRVQRQGYAAPIFDIKARLVGNPERLATRATVTSERIVYPDAELPVHLAEIA